MILQQILRYDTIDIQCHNIPDADTVASGFALYCYCRDAGKNVRLFYSGPEKATKPNIVKMIESLGIPLEYDPLPRAPKGLLLLVDCQYGEQNVSAPSAPDMCVIDHHIQSGQPPALHDIRSYLASCATLVWALLCEAGYAMDQRVRTALHYGLYMDSQGFEELGHPLDRDLRDQSGLDEELLRMLKNSNLSLEDLYLASSSLRAFNYCEQGRYMLVEAPHCDPSILGFISDLAMQVDNVDMVVAYSHNPDGVKLSVRSVTKENKAADLASYISSGLGSGGGNVGKAGGRLDWQKLRELHDGRPVTEVIRGRMDGFLKDYETVDCANLRKLKTDYAARREASFVDFSELREYEKRAEHLAFVRCADHFSTGVKFHVRMLEGDIAFTLNEDTYLMIGGAGEVYPIQRKDFEMRYSVVDKPVNLDLHYKPVILDTGSGERHLLTSLASSCLTREGVRALAAPLKKGVKMFTAWDRSNYVKGNAGDWLLINPEAQDDWYLVTRERFPQIYSAV